MRGQGGRATFAEGWVGNSFSEETGWFVTQGEQFPFRSGLLLSNQPPVSEETSQEVRRNVGLTHYLNH